jgi:hypothetical protein
LLSLPSLERAAEGEHPNDEREARDDKLGEVLHFKRVAKVAPGSDDADSEDHPAEPPRQTCRGAEQRRQRKIEGHDFGTNVFEKPIFVLVFRRWWGLTRSAMDMDAASSLSNEAVLVSH